MRERKEAMWKYPFILMAVLLLASNAPAATIYIWTDADGVKHFSDQPPPQGTEDYDVAQGVIDPSGTEQRDGFKQMMKEVEQESMQADQEREAKKAAQAATEKEKKADEQQARIHAERDKLQKKIDALNNRALSTTFTEGMRQNQIDAILKEMEKIE
jgi:hypothetical protein